MTPSQRKSWQRLCLLHVTNNSHGVKYPKKGGGIVQGETFYRRAIFAKVIRAVSSTWKRGFISLRRRRGNLGVYWAFGDIRADTWRWRETGKSGKEGGGNVRQTNVAQDKHRHLSSARPATSNLHYCDWLLICRFPVQANARD